MFERVLVDHGNQKSLLTIGKPGILWKLDRATGKFIAAKQTVYNNVYENFDEKTGKVTYRKDIRDQKVDQWLASCPGPEGGHDWQAMSYHQPSDAVIIPLSQSCVFMLGNGSQTYFEMPGTDGFAFAEAVRSHGRWREKPMVALTSRTSPGDLDRGRVVGFSDYVAKFDRDTLLKSLSQTLAQAS